MALQPPPRASQPRHAVFDYRPPLVLRLIRWGLMGLVGAAVLCVAYTGYWFYVASAFRDGLPAWIERMAGAGATLAYRQLEISGFPFAFRLIFHEPLLDASDVPALAGAPLRWRADRVMATMSPWNFDRYTIDLAGKHRLDWTSGAGPAMAEIDAGAFTATIDIYDDGMPEELAIRTSRLKIAPSDGAVTPSNPGWVLEEGHVTARRLFPDPAVTDKPTFELGFDIANARFPGRNLPLGNDLARFMGDVRIVGHLGNPTARDNLARWRDAGGIVEFTLGEARYGPLAAHANGTAALDDALQPMTAGTAKVGGLFATIDALRERDLVRSRDAAMAKVMLGVLSRPGEGGVPTVSLPFSIQGQKLFAGPVPLMDIPPIAWPQAASQRPRFMR